MSDLVHVVPVGTDVERLFLPLTQGELRADAVRLYRSERRDRDGEESALADRMFDRLEYTFETVLGIRVESETIDDVYDYRTLYKAAYTEVRDRTQRGDEVWVNISSMPRTVAFAFATAANTFVNEHPEHRTDVHIYYVPPEEYLVTTLLDELEDLSSFLADAGGDDANELTARADDVDDLLTTVRGRGLTRGARRIDGRHYVELPTAPLGSLRTFEKRLLRFLGDAGEMASTSELSRRLAAEIEGQEADESFRSKVQYNARQLEEKGYLERVASENRYITRLSTMGELWVETHPAE